MSLSHHDLGWLVHWWLSGTPEMVPIQTLRRLKASRYAALTRNGLVLTLAGQNRAARIAARDGWQIPA